MAESRRLQEDLSALLKEEAALEAEERALWTQLGELERGQEGFQDKVGSPSWTRCYFSTWYRGLTYRIKSLFNEQRDQALKEVVTLHSRVVALDSSSPLTELFSLDLEANPPTLNGFCIARREVPKKELWWPEVNAGWGQVCE